MLKESSSVMNIWPFEICNDPTYINFEWDYSKQMHINFDACSTQILPQLRCGRLDYNECSEEGRITFNAMMNPNYNHCNDEGRTASNGMRKANCWNLTKKKSL
ncbi:hypothetical protein CEXT_807451 [Caerostris extrusa]|uniref:Uncharacterized protein n=1 Tax=Caerostris extrusa TaxID=172846 RepID=A0AAV4SY00_CAEEX|nr:hypothetical protein CEXT_807451 [Caerostris extrusa]